MNRQVLSNILKDHYHIMEAENGKIALSLLHENKDNIAVVLLDIIMPVMDGYEVLKKMHCDKSLSKIPVIVASGESGEEAEVRALSLGANDYVLKPYQPDIIKHRIANTIYLKETSAFVNSVQHDSLTKVYSKDFFYLKVKEILDNKPTSKYDLICLDVERFKLVNDIYGIKIGDKLLQSIAKVLMKYVSEIGFCGRIGADEFVCFVERINHYQEQQFIDFIKSVNAVSNINLELNLHFGIYQIEDYSTPVNIMCDRAILAKNSIKSKYNLYFAFYCYESS